MIGHIRGTLLDKRAPWLLLDVAGVGYELEAPMTVFYELGAVGEDVAFFTHFVFRALIKVNGVGPKMALVILSGMEAARLVRCIEQQDITSLVKVPGVGKKTAERLVIEMSDRIAKLEGGHAVAAGGGVGGTQLDIPVDAVQDAVAALEALGYRSRDASLAVAKVDGAEALSSEELIRRALKSLAR